MVDLEKNLAEKWKFLYFRNFAIICIIRYAEHCRKCGKFILL